MLGYADISPTNIPLLITAGRFCSAPVCLRFFLPDTPPKAPAKWILKVMLGTDALILLRDKTSSSFLLFIPVCDATGVLLHLCQRLSDRSWHENATGWMTLGQFSGNLLLCWHCRFSLNALVSKGIVAWSGHRCDPLWLLFTVVRMNISPTRYCSSVFLLHGVRLRFYYVTAYIYVDKSSRAYAYRRAGADHALLPGASAVCSAIVLAV